MTDIQKQLAEVLAEAKANLPTMQERETVYCSIRGDHLRTLVEFVSDHVIKGTDIADTTQAAALTDEKLAETMANAECLPGEEEVWQYLGESERNRWRAAARVAKSALAAQAVPIGAEQISESAQRWEIERAQAFAPAGWKLVPVEPTPQMLSCLVRRKWPEDMEAGKRLQARQRGENRVPFKTEYEIAAGQYERMLAAALAALAAHRQQEARKPMTEYRLFDSQWVNVVNHPAVLNEFDALEAVHKAVKLTEAAMAMNIADNNWPAAHGIKGE